jgi:Polyketide cyclase / dehydrase and lipid transport
VERVAGFLGRRIRYVNEITGYEPGRRLAMRSVEAPFPMTVAYEFEPDGDGGTLARITAGGEPGRFYALAGPLLPALVKQGIRRDLRTLKRRLEG